MNLKKNVRNTNKRHKINIRSTLPSTPWVPVDFTYYTNKTRHLIPLKLSLKKGTHVHKNGNCNSVVANILRNMQFVKINIYFLTYKIHVTLQARLLKYSTEIKKQLPESHHLD